MTPGQLLYSLLTADAAVAALVASRVYPLRIAQGEPLPAITYQQISLVPGPCQGFDRFRYQVSLFAASYEQLNTLSQAVRAVLHEHEDGEIYLQLDQELDQFSEGATTYYRTQDYFIDFPNPLAS